MNALTHELLTRFPELRSRMAAGDEELPYQMMGHLFDWVLEEMREGRFEDISPRIVYFTDWCELQPAGPGAGDDIATVYATGFYEKLFVHEETRPLVTRITTRENLRQPPTREYLIGAVGEEAYEQTLEVFDHIPPSVRRLWAGGRRYRRNRFLGILGIVVVVLVCLWALLMVPEIRGYHTYVALLNGQPVPLRKVVIHRPERWELTDEASLKYIAAHLRRKRIQAPIEKDFEATGTLVFGPWTRVSSTDYAFSPDYEYLLVLHDDFGHEYYYRVPIHDDSPRELRGMVYAMTESGRIERAEEERREEAQRQEEQRQEQSGEPRIRLPGGN